MTSRNGRDDEAREGVVLPSHRGPWDDPGAETVTAPTVGQPWGQPWGPDQRNPVTAQPAHPPEQAPYQPQPGHQAHPSQQPYEPHQQYPSQPPRQQPGAGRHALPQQATPPMPSTPPAGPDEAATQMIPPITGGTSRPEAGGDYHPATQLVPQITGDTPPPPQHHEAATQLIQPITDADPHGAATQLIPPVVADTSTAKLRQLPAPGGAVDSEGATQLIPPIKDVESTTRLRAVTRPAGGGGRHGRPAGHAAPPAGPASSSGIEATQMMPPITDAGPPPAPHGRRAAPAGPAGPPHGGRAAARRAAGPAPSARNSPALLIAAVVIGCAIVGLAAGALLGGGEGSGDDGPGSTEQDGILNGGPEAEGTREDGAGAPEDEHALAQAQAQALSDLLEDSSGSRESVIAAVDHIKTCDRLGEAAEDLRAAGEERNGLVTRLDELALDRLPDHQSLSDALREAWQASAAADYSYAAWAEELKDNRKACRGGSPRHTDNASQAEQSSGQATSAKERAATLWNPVAGQYGLPTRDASQL
ncbi:hypothetical protein ACWD33_14830 [Streptomyces xiamenensis]|uniref:Membrane protein n=1 Tax=Streptomyces xiamenensis TaxID=408015 RepID=A0A0F7FWH0_9ACTN|nr:MULTISPECIES: hypothetical protein [Streptomyces]AKG44673.1 membrane protein [Streptomyces xiamenensis]